MTYNSEGWDAPAPRKDALHRSMADIAVFPSCVEKPYKYMFEKLNDRSDALNARLDDMAERITRKHGLLLPPPLPGHFTPVPPFQVILPHCSAPLPGHLAAFPAGTCFHLSPP